MINLMDYSASLIAHLFEISDVIRPNLKSEKFINVDFCQGEENEKIFRKKIMEKGLTRVRPKRLTVKNSTHMRLVDAIAGLTNDVIITQEVEAKDLLESILEKGVVKRLGLVL